ncbi:hypothetical protein AX13_01895 [Comamonas aquatica DA1877]|uniref:Uncharacterized protein n=1 Tax=Comamonas aquatica DA1877 TaxID=1457173 RepID=A0A014P1T3_9BURK|nr:hypothetical protein AX13_01895 [Comamonas aquatica DA1877]
MTRYQKHIYSRALFLAFGAKDIAKAGQACAGRYAW